MISRNRKSPLVQLGRLLRGFHDAAATFSGTGREWQVLIRQPVETICHNDVSPGNVIFRAGMPAALIDWESAAPGPRGWDLGYAAWRWVPFWTDEQCREAGLPMNTADKAHRYRLLLQGYGVEPDLDLLRLGTERMRGYLDHQRNLVAQGSAWEVEMARRGVLERMTDQITWVEDHAAALADS